MNMIYFLLRLPDSLFFRWFPGSRRDCSGSGATGPLHPASQLMNKVQVAAVSNKKLLLTKILANTKLYVFFPSKSTDIQSLKTNISENWMVGRWYETFGAAFPEKFQGFVYINAWIIFLPQTISGGMTGVPQEDLTQSKQVNAPDAEAPWKRMRDDCGSWERYIYLHVP